MPARLIINADDFGLTPGINRAIAELHAAGVLTSATLMANGPAFDDAVAIARAHPTLGVGCHIVLTDGVPISNPSRIPTLLDPASRTTFRPKLSSFVRDLLLERIAEEHIAHEAILQIRKLQQSGIHPTHIDTHKHTHLFPRVLRPLLQAARHTGIEAIRYPFEPAFARELPHASRLRRAALRLTRILRPRWNSLLAQHPAATTDGTLGISATGSLTPDTLAAILHALPSTGAWELCCHPGYNDSDLDRVATRLRTHRDTEREALLAAIPKLLAQPNPPQLIRYTDR